MMMLMMVEETSKIQSGPYFGPLEDVSFLMMAHRERMGVQQQSVVPVKLMVMDVASYVRQKVMQRDGNWMMVGLMGAMLIHEERRRVKLKFSVLLFFLFVATL